MNNDKYTKGDFFVLPCRTVLRYDGRFVNEEMAQSNPVFEKYLESNYTTVVRARGCHKIFKTEFSTLCSTNSDLEKMIRITEKGI